MLKYLNFILLLESSIMCNLCSYFYQIMLEILNTVQNTIKQLMSIKLQHKCCFNIVLKCGFLLISKRGPK